MPLQREPVLLGPPCARDADRLAYTGSRYAVYFDAVITSFGDKRTEELFSDAFVKEFQGVARRAKRSTPRRGWRS